MIAQQLREKLLRAVRNAKERKRTTSASKRAAQTAARESWALRAPETIQKAWNRERFQILGTQIGRQWAADAQHALEQDGRMLEDGTWDVGEPTGIIEEYKENIKRYANVIARKHVSSQAMAQAGKKISRYPRRDGKVPKVLYRRLNTIGKWDDPTWHTIAHFPVWIARETIDHAQGDRRTDKGWRRALNSITNEKAEQNERMLWAGTCETIRWCVDAASAHWPKKTDDNAKAHLALSLAHWPGFEAPCPLRTAWKAAREGMTLDSAQWWGAAMEIERKDHNEHNDAEIAEDLKTLKQTFDQRIHERIKHQARRTTMGEKIDWDKVEQTWSEEPTLHTENPSLVVSGGRAQWQLGWNPALLLSYEESARTLSLWVKDSEGIITEIDERGRIGTVNAIRTSRPEHERERRRRTVRKMLEEHKKC